MHEPMKRENFLQIPSTLQAIADYWVYTVKIAELLETRSPALLIVYDNEYRKLQSKYGFR